MLDTLYTSVAFQAPPVSSLNVENFHEKLERKSITAVMCDLKFATNIKTFFVMRSKKYVLGEKKVSSSN